MSNKDFHRLQNNLKTNLQTVLWMDESRTTLDGPDGWSRSWLQKDSNPYLHYKHQQGGGGLMSYWKLGFLIFFRSRGP